MPFVNNDLLTELLREISALRQQVTGLSQQVTGQQHAAEHAVERIREDTNRAAIGHLNEAREVARRALNDTRDTIAALLAEIHTRLGELQAGTRPEPPHPHESRPPTTSADPDNEKRFNHCLLAAASIASARLTCHRDTWAFAVEQTARTPHFRLPGKATPTGNGKVQVALSGRSLVAILIALRHTADTHRPGGTALDLGNWALAATTYAKFTAAILSVDNSSQAADSLQNVTVTIDDKIGPPRTTAPAEEPEEEPPTEPASEEPDPDPDPDDGIGD